MWMRPGHLGDLMAIMRGASVLEREAQDAANIAGPVQTFEKAQVLATLALSKRLECLIHIQLYNSPEEEDELG